MASQAPPPRFDPASYPGPRPSGPVLVRAGRARPLRLGGPGTWPYTGAATAHVPSPLHYSVAYGSNACVERLVDKGLDEVGAVLLPARLRGWVAAYAARRTRYGSVPVALVPGDPGSVADTWVLGLGPGALGTLDATEGRRPTGTGPGAALPVGYVLGCIGPVAVADRYLLCDALAYLPAPGTRLLAGPSGPLTWPGHDQRAASEALERGAPTVEAPPVERVVAGAWPATPLADLPLFVYGSLQPSGAAWPVVADLVEVVGEASASGRVYTTPHGWPAADLDGDGRIRGVLLAPRGPQAAVELTSRADAYEGAPGLFRRRAVVVQRPDGTWTWAMAYQWGESGPPPGRELVDGRWDPARHGKP